MALLLSKFNKSALRVVLSTPDMEKCWPHTQQKPVGSWRSGPVNNGPHNLYLLTCRSGVGIGPDHDPDGMLSRTQPADMPIVVIAGIFRDPGIYFADLLAIKENVSPAALLAAAAHNGNTCANKCKRRLRTWGSCFLKLKLFAPRQLEFSVIEPAFEHPSWLGELHTLARRINVPLLEAALEVLGPVLRFPWGSPCPRLSSTTFRARAWVLATI